MNWSRFIQDKKPSQPIYLGGGTHMPIIETKDVIVVLKKRLIGTETEITTLAWKHIRPEQRWRQ